MNRAHPPIAMAEPQPGDFCCVPITGWVGLGVEVGQFLDGDKFQPYEHAMVYVGQPDLDGPHGYTVSAYPNGKGRLPLPVAPDQLPGSFWSSGIIELTPPEREGIVGWCLAHENVQYAALDYLVLAAHRFHLNLPAVRRRIESTHQLICSQFVDASYLVGGDVHLFDDGRWPGYVKPGDLAQLLRTKLPAVLRGRAG